MKRYRFRLETISRIRNLQEQVARDRVMRAQYELQMAHISRDERAEELRSYEMPSDVASVAELAWVGMQGERLGTSLAMAEKDIEEKEKVCVEAKEQWNERKKQASAVARLKANGYRKWQSEMLREETREFDDIATIRFALQGRKS